MVPQVRHICFQMFPGHRQQMEEMSAETGSDLLRHTEQNQEFGSGAALICRITALLVFLPLTSVWSSLRLLCVLPVKRRWTSSPAVRFVSQLLSSASSAATEEQSLHGAAAVRRCRRGCVQRRHHAAGAGLVCAGIHQRKNTQPQSLRANDCLQDPARLGSEAVNLSAGLCWTLRGFIHLVWGSGRCCSECLRGPDQEVHRSHQNQHVLDRSGPHRLRPGENV